VEKHPYVIGDFVWTAMDYLGEAGLAHSLLSGQKDSPCFFLLWIFDFRLVAASVVQHLSAMRKLLAVVLVNTSCAWIAAAGPVSPDPAGTWVLATAPAFRTVLQPLIEHRRNEGFRVVVIETTNVLTPDQILAENAAPLRERISELKGASRTFVLLAGAPAVGDRTNAVQLALPPLPGTTARMKGEPSDFGYCLPHTNGAPRIAVGRFPALTLEEMRAMVRKTLDLEQGSSVGEWQRRVLLLVGDTGGGPLADMVVESVFSQWLKELDSCWTVDVVFASPASRFYLPQRAAHDRFLGQLEQGSLFSLFLGHSAPEGMWLAGNSVVSREEWAAAHMARGAGVFFSCGCWANRFQGGTNQGYGVTAMRNPKGPVAVIGPNGESYSFAGELTTVGLARCLKRVPFPSRLGDYWTAAQRELAVGEMDSSRFALYDMFDGSQGKVPLAVQRIEHLEMWMLLGDPALRLPLPVPDIVLEAPESVHAGGSVVVKGILPARSAGTTVLLTLERPLDSRPIGLEPLPVFSRTNRASVAQTAMANHRKANEFVLASAEVESSGGVLSNRIEVPAQIPWSNLVIRASATLTNELLTGVTRVSVSCGSEQ
jgi:hypothetical protein